MIDYPTAKSAMIAGKHSTRYFTKSFYDLYVKCMQDVQENRSHGIDDCIPYTTESGSEICVHAPHIPLFSTDFYRKNGTSYCAFLEIMHSRHS